MRLVHTKTSRLTTFQAKNAVSPLKNLPTWKLRIGICVSDKDAAMAGRTTGMQDSLIHFRKIIANSSSSGSGAANEDKNKAPQTENETEQVPAETEKIPDSTPVPTT